ncbi:hypothetical protein PIB30_031304 [Stylosanthes scabra]|uniref:DUF1985 domain-containing protein n=1 Tax=Stylosanthes scabra TaxID=79078 RepID=A0ABU6QBB4_9FABA|nr:hypothetical protein [Stylosanthes scabra]
MPEVEAMGFADFQYIPEWTVNQEIYTYLATKFDVENNLIKDDVANIEINAEIVERALRLPSGGDDFPDYNLKDLEYKALKSRCGNYNLKDLKEFVINCPLQTEEQRMLFREAFILLLGKTFLCPTTNEKLSLERHFPLIVDVKNPQQYNWSLQILTLIKDAIEDYQTKGVKHLSACMFIVVIIYFQRLKRGRLDKCRSVEPWIIDWSLPNLEHRATAALKKRIMLEKKNKKAEKNCKENKQAGEKKKERDDQSEEGVVEGEEFLKKWTQIEEELKSQRRTVGNENKKLTKEQEAEVEATLKDAEECFLDYIDGDDEGIPSFSLDFSQEFKSPKRSMHEEILDIAPLNEIIPENIPFQEAENPINMRPTRELTAEEQKKIYNWIMKASKEDTVREEMIAKIATSMFNTLRIEVFQKSYEPLQRRNNPNRYKKKEVKTPFTAPNIKEITKRAEGNKAAGKRKKK